MKKVSTLIFAILFVSAYTCAHSRKAIRGDVYPVNSSNLGYSFRLNDNDFHYLFGEREVHLDSLYGRKGVSINRAAVGREDSWITMIDFIPGRCMAVDQTPSYLYVVIEESFGRHGGPPWVQKLYKVNKSTGEAIELYEWGGGLSHVWSVHFDSDDVGYMFYLPTGNSRDSQLMKTKNGGLDWNFVNIHRSIQSPKSYDKLFFMSYKRNVKNWIYSIDKESNVLDSVYFDLVLKDFAIDEDNAYWLLGESKNKSILRYHHDGVDSVVKVFSENENFTPDKLLKFNEAMVVTGHTIDQSLLFGFGGTRPSMYVSKNNGLTWIEVDLQNTWTLDAVSLYKDEKVLANLRYPRRESILIFNLNNSQ